MIPRFSPIGKTQLQRKLTPITTAWLFRLGKEISDTAAFICTHICLIGGLIWKIPTGVSMKLTIQVHRMVTTCSSCRRSQIQSREMNARLYGNLEFEINLNVGNETMRFYLLAIVCSVASRVAHVRNHRSVVSDVACWWVKGCCSKTFEASHSVYDRVFQLKLHGYDKEKKLSSHCQDKRMWAG